LTIYYLRFTHSSPPERKDKKIFPFQKGTSATKEFKFVFNGVYVLRTRFSHGAGEMRATDKFRTQLKLNENQLKGVIQCTFEYEDYVALLKQKRLIPDNV